MQTGKFYFLKKQYLIDFPDKKLMISKDRPCFYAFYDDTTSLYWLIPFSSQVEKFTDIYQKKIERYGICDTIVFGEILGYKKAFLIQNMCPVTSEYIENEYIDHKSSLPVRINGLLEKELTIKAKKVLALQRKGSSLIFPDVLKIESVLLLKNKTKSEVAVTIDKKHPENEPIINILFKKPSI